MKMKLCVAVIAGSFGLAGCGGGGGDTTEEAAPQLCYSRTDVAELPVDWISNVVVPRDSGDAQALRAGTDVFAEKIKDISWSIPDGSDCIGYRESLEMTKEALLLAQAVNNGTDTDADYQSVADTGDAFMDVMEMRENGYNEIQVSFPINADEMKKLSPNS
ncbi:hypothetical protein [Brevibacterium casei]|uniref:hypothetical protein n=1 Tax=Brevibacterium casei TaxID=33889 RepID=UPI0036FCFEFE